MSVSSDAPAASLLVAGCGLIGSSLARVARERGLARRILVADVDARTRAQVEALGLADVVAADAATLAAEAELIAVCTPPSAVADVVSGALAAAPETAVVFDVASVKAGIAEAVAERAGARAAAFVPSHPIAGTERSGPRAGFADLFVNRWCILTPEGCSDAATARVADFWRACGARVAVMRAREHDALLAATSHVPHLVAYALTATAQDETGAADPRIVRYSAGGFRDFTRIAASDPVMWRDVFLANREAVLGALDRFEAALAELRREVETGDGASLEALFARTRAVRGEIVAEGQETPEADFGRPHGGDDEEE